jgi:hypothetical protein
MTTATEYEGHRMTWKGQALLEGTFRMSCGALRCLSLRSNAKDTTLL